MSPRRAVLLSAALWALVAAGLTTSPARAAAPKMRVAVLEFANASSDAGLEALGKGLQSMITTDLSKAGELSLIERARLQEILDEQKLGGSGLIDKATAARVGKLAGATHLLGGTFTVHGAQMRLDARLFSVAGGEVLLAEEITGERDAFFELEKSLVRKLVGALGIELAPKERAGLARIHTADFDAFKRFSEGVARFDAKRYEEAMDAMRAAMAIDASFDLARVTLGEYEALVAKIRSKAERLELTGRELEKLKADAVAQNDSLVAQRLVDIAGKGSGKAHRMERLAALTYLIGFYNPYGRNHGRISRFQDRFDRMVLRRRIGALARRYLSEAREVFPGAPLFSFGLHPPDKPEDVDGRVAAVAKALGQGLEHRPEHRDQALIQNLVKVEDFAKLLALDHHERASLTALALEKLDALGAEAYPRIQLLEQLADIDLEMGDVDGASGSLARASALMTSPRDLESTAARIEQLGELSKLLDKTDKEELLRELIAGKGGRLRDKELAWFAERGAPTPELLHELAETREVERWWAHKDPYWIFGSEPAHLIQGEHVLYTGPRTAHVRSDALRYYRPASMDERDVLVAIGRGTHDAVDASFELSYAAPRDFWPRSAWPRSTPRVEDLKLDPGAPEVSLVFGLHDIDVVNVRDPDKRENFYPTPTQGYAVRITPDAVELIRLGEDGPSPDLRKKVMTTRTLASDKPGARGDRTKVRVRVSGRTVQVEVGRSSARFELPSADAAAGYVGLHFRGQGYAAVDDLALK